MFFENLMQNISGKGVLKYTLLPQVAPRINNFILSGFGNLAYFMALVYQAVRLLPANHPYLKKGATGTFSIRDVLTEASNNLKFDLKHIDQIIIYFSIIIGIAILAIQFLLFLVAILINPASAGTSMPTNYAEFFTTPNPDEDIAFRLLDSVFGVPNIFGSIEPTETAFHTALHGLFQFYSIGLLVIAGMIMIYFIFVVLAETAQTGTPFGKRYNHAWVPIRLVVAIGLLIPISYGLNSAQWITLYAAKMGSGFATNGWILFHETLAGSPALPDELVAANELPDYKDIAAFMMMAHACKEAYVFWEDDGSEAFVIRNIDAYVISPDDTKAAQKLETFGSFTQAAIFAENKNIIVRFGEQNDAEHSKYSGNVKPFCGEISIIVSEPASSTSGGPYYNTAYEYSPTNTLNNRNFVLIQRLWNEGDGAFGKKLAKPAQDFMVPRLSHKKITPIKPATLKSDIINDVINPHIQQGLKIAINQTIKQLQADDTYATLGWGGAGIWYNTIANVNGKVLNALMNKPQIKNYPLIMEKTCKENQQQNKDTSPKDCYNPILSKGDPIEFATETDARLAKGLSDMFDYWYEDPEEVTGNAFIDTINAIFGTQGLFEMCKNANVNPVAQLATMGKGLIESAIRNLGFALGTGVAGILVPYIGPSLQAASSFFITVASIGILIGFILYYLVPFLPFLYFLFAVGGWIKGLFEAMVGVPLWALAHIRIDGQGLPGDGAINGYFLIFEIFIRPILIIFGLIASILIFGAMVKVLNEIFSIVVSNLSGNNPDVSAACGGGKLTPSQIEMQKSMADTIRGPIDEFFYTIVYAILVYMIGMSAFKLIDLIPNNILRWMGQGVQTFNDQAGEPAEGLLTKMAVGGSLLGGQLQQAGSAFGQATGQGLAGVKNLVKGS